MESLEKNVLYMGSFANRVVDISSSQIYFLNPNYSLLGWCKPEG